MFQLGVRRPWVVQDSLQDFPDLPDCVFVVCLSSADSDPFFYDKRPLSSIERIYVA